MIDKNVTKLNYEGKEIFLVATAHVSKESVQLVKEVIDKEQPDSICIELDEARYKNIQNPKAWENTDIIKVIKSKKVGFLLANIALSSYQKNIAKKLNTTVGQEMLQGIESAKEIGSELVLADRDIQTTFLRIWRKSSLWNKCKVIVSLFSSLDDDNQVTTDDLKELMEKDKLEGALAEIKEQFPQIGEILISERDQHLAYKIKNAPGKKIVAVLGAAHIAGVKDEIFQTQHMDEITKVPPASPVTKIINWTICISLVCLILYGFNTSLQTGFQQISTWVLWTGSLAAIFTALSFGHPLSILTAFISAPMTTLHPLLACGWFVGLVEATLRKPTVGDVSNISDDISSFKGFFQNRFLRTLLIVIMANIGSSIGTITAGMDIVKTLF